MLYRREVTSVLRSRNLVGSLGHEILESMPRTNRSIPTPPAEVVPKNGTAPVSASPLALPDPKPSRTLAFFVDPEILLVDLICFTPGPLGTGVVLDLPRVFLETGYSCAVGSRYEIACSPIWVPTKVPPHPAAEPWPMALEATGKKAITVRASASRAYRELEATRTLVYHMLDLLCSHHIVLQSGHRVILHGASELGDADGAVRQPGAGTGAAGTGVPATKPVVAVGSSIGLSSRGAVSDG